MKKQDEYKFAKDNRYITRGVASRIPIEIQVILWMKIDELVKSDIEADYLQIYEFKISEDEILITHKQEEPEFAEKFYVNFRSGYELLHNIKIYVIDDITHSTMLLAEEY